MTQNFKKHLSLNIYEIYPRSFCDSNGDGIGDIKGVISKLDYLCELGVNAIWLCPCYKSPNVDNGYDISDYRDIMDEFGTMEDIKELISQMHSRDMKLIMDLVPNHTSDRHKWFEESRKSKDNPYSDYYYWFDEPQNNWHSAFGGSAWQYDRERGQYYLHSYAVGQPDLNWDNPKVVKEMQDVVDFWVDMGVDGFRVDVIDQISKRWEKGGINCFGPHLHEYIHALFGREKTKHIFTVGECWCENIEEIRKHCSEERGELVTLFQFDHIHCGRLDKWEKGGEDKFRKARDILIKWQTLTAEQDIIYSIFTDNHDQSPYISRMGDVEAFHYESATMLAAMFYLLKGAAFIYQGQEFGTTASEYNSLDDFDDIESLNYYKRHIKDSAENHQELLNKINFGSRDNARRPMAWNGEKYHGFSTAKPWITSASRSSKINYEADRNREKSIFDFYKAILKMRNSSDAIKYGSFYVLSKAEDAFFAYGRELDGEKYIVICNFDCESLIIPPKGELVLSNYGRTSADDSIFRPYETAVYKI